jgi:hypothetical protein
MNKLPNNDQKLVEFLRQNRPDLPPENQDLEAQIMAAVAATPRSESGQNSSVIPFRRRSLWLMPPAIAAGLLIAWGTSRLLTPPPQTATELASLEVFIENTWDEVLDQDSQDWYLDF